MKKIPKSLKGYNFWRINLVSKIFIRSKIWIFSTIFFGSKLEPRSYNFLIIGPFLKSKVLHTYLAFLQFSCFHRLNLPEEFSTKTHIVQSSPNSGETLTTSFLWSYGISLVNKVVWGMPPERSSKRNPPTSSLVLTYQLNSTWSSFLRKKNWKEIEFEEEKKSFEKS